MKGGEGVKHLLHYGMGTHPSQAGAVLGFKGQSDWLGVVMMQDDVPLPPSYWSAVASSHRSSISVRFNHNNVTT